MSVTLELLDQSTPVPQKMVKGSRARDGGASASSSAGNSPDKTGILRKLADLLTEDDLESAVQCWRDGMKAVKMVWNAKLQMYIEGGPDWQIRAEMSAMVAAYMEGKPMERQLNISGSFVELSDMIKAMSVSGEAMRLLPGVASLPFATEGNG